MICPARSHKLCAKVFASLVSSSRLPAVAPNYCCYTSATSIVTTFPVVVCVVIREGSLAPDIGPNGRDSLRAQCSEESERCNHLALILKPKAGRRARFRAHASQVAKCGTQAAGASYKMLPVWQEEDRCIHTCETQRAGRLKASERLSVGRKRGVAAQKMFVRLQCLLRSCSARCP
eukprot:293433-Amphidinium_carterae.1